MIFLYNQKAARTSLSKLEPHISSCIYQTSTFHACILHKYIVCWDTFSHLLTNVCILQIYSVAFCFSSNFLISRLHILIYRLTFRRYFECFGSSFSREIKFDFTHSYLLCIFFILFFARTTFFNFDSNIWFFKFR